MNLTGDRIVQLPSCLRNTSSANDISANSIEPYTSPHQHVAFGFDLFGRRRATEALGKPRDGLFGIFHDEPRLVACYGRILVRSPPASRVEKLGVWSSCGGAARRPAIVRLASAEGLSDDLSGHRGPRRGHVANSLPWRLSPRLREAVRSTQASLSRAQVCGDRV